MFLRRQILIENPSAYIQFKSSVIPEPEFLELIANRTGCGLLLDVNNIYVSSYNNKLDPNVVIKLYDQRQQAEPAALGHPEWNRVCDWEKRLAEWHHWYQPGSGAESGVTSLDPGMEKFWRRYFCKDKGDQYFC